MSTSAEDFFAGNAKSASYKGAAPITWHGVITRIGEQVQATEYNAQDPKTPGAPKFYPSGDPVMQLPITIQTDVRDPADPSDDGQRTIYIGGDKRRALKMAFQAAGTRGPKVGDWLALTYTGDDPNSKGNTPKKLFKADYAVNPNAGAAGFFQEPAPAQAAPQPTFQPPVPAAPSWNQQVAQAGPAPAFAGQVTAPAAAASPFAPVADNGQAPWPPAQAQQSAFVQAAAPEIAAMQPAGAQPDQPLAAARPWGNVPA